MIRRLVLRRLDREERRLGESVEYVRHVVRTSLPSFVRFALFSPMASYRRALPADAHAVAGLVSTRHADCGTCLQIGVNLARQEGVPAPILQAVIDRHPEALPEHLAQIYRFAEAVVASDPEADALREEVRARYGEEGLVELGLAIAAAGVFPLLKRTLGYAVSCSRVEVKV
jgi:alkylhydroperoxidase family enzyme